MFSKRLAQLRKENNYTQKELADKFGLTPKAISFYELGQRDPSNELIIKFSKFFNVSIDYLMGTSDDRHGKSTVDDELLEGFPEGVQILRRANRELTPEAKAKMIEIANIFIDSVNAKENEEREK